MYNYKDSLDYIFLIVVAAEIGQGNELSLNKQ